MQTQLVCKLSRLLVKKKKVIRSVLGYLPSSFRFLVAQNVDLIKGIQMYRIKAFRFTCNKLWNGSGYRENLTLNPVV